MLFRNFRMFFYKMVRVAACVIIYSSYFAGLDVSVLHWWQGWVTYVLVWATGVVVSASAPLVCTGVGAEEPLSALWTGGDKRTPGTNGHPASRPRVILVKRISTLRNTSTSSLICGFMICCIKIWLLNKENDLLYDRYVPAGKNASLDKNLRFEG